MSNKDQIIAELKAQLEASNKELEAFAYSVSHDLRVPLRGIDGFSQALVEEYSDKLDQQGLDYLGRVRKSSQRMGMLIEDLLKLSRVTSMEMKREPVDLSTLARAVVDDLKRDEPDRNIEIVIDDDLNTQGDQGLLRAVLENLLGNAWKFTSKQESAKVEMGKMDIKGTETFFIRDDGAGFDMRYASKLFGVFQRLHSGAEFSGTGIGLASVYRILTRHGGRIWADAEVGKGASFYFIL